MKFIHRSKIHAVETSNGIKWEDPIYHILDKHRFHNVHVITNVKRQLARIMENA